MELRYLTPLTYPSRFANRLQVIKMSEAFSRPISSFALYLRELRTDKEKIFFEYNIKRPFRIEVLGTPWGFPRSLFFALRARQLISKEPKAVWYLRDGLLAYWLTFFGILGPQNFFFELHAFRLPRFVYRGVLKNACGVITTNGKKALDIEREFGVKREKILTALNGVNIEAFVNLPSASEARLKLGLPQDKKLIIYTGVPSAEKGMLVLLDAAGLLPEDIKIISVGGGEREWSEFRKHPNFKKITWIQQVPYEKLPLYLAAGNLLAAPFSGKNSWTTFYTSPLKIPVYLASGRPMIISDLPSTREFVSEKEAFFFRPDDAEDFVKTALSTLNNPEIMLQKGNLAREKAQEFSWDKRAEKIIKFMEKLARK